MGSTHLDDVLAPKQVEGKQGAGEGEVACQVDGGAAVPVPSHVDDDHDANGGCQEKCCDKRPQDGERLVRNRMESCGNSGVDLRVAHSRSPKFRQADNSKRHLPFVIEMDGATWMLVGITVGVLLSLVFVYYGLAPFFDSAAGAQFCKAILEEAR